LNYCEGLLEVGMRLEAGLVDRIEEKVAKRIGCCPNVELVVVPGQRKSPGLGVRKLVEWYEEGCLTCLTKSSNFVLELDGFANASLTKNNDDWLIVKILPRYPSMVSVEKFVPVQPIAVGRGICMPRFC